MTAFRTRIRYSTLSLIAVLLTTFSIVVWAGFRSILQQYVDSRLQAIAEDWVDIINRQTPMILELTKEASGQAHASLLEGEEQLEFREAALSIQILALNGSIVWKGATGGSLPTLPQDLLAEVYRGEMVFDVITPPRGASIRRVSVPIRQQGVVQNILQAHTSLSLIEKTLNWLSVLLGAASLLTLTIAWFGSGRLARQIIKPVEALSATAQTVSESALGLRVSLDAPYEEFGKLVYAFNTMMDRLQKVFEAQGRFLVDVAHEIQTPLTVLKGNLEVLFRKKRRVAEYREVLISNLNEIERLICLSRSLITLTRFAGGTMMTDRGVLELEPLIRTLINELSILAKDRKVSLTSQADATPTVLGNKAQLERVLINLIDNALRYTPADGIVSVRLQTDGRHAIITVRDNGVGIGPEHLPHIFERFYRADSARSKESGGTGLGLAIVKEIVEAHGGAIEVESELGYGSCFTIRLPAVMVSTAN